MRRALVSVFVAACASSSGDEPKPVTPPAAEAPTPPPATPPVDPPPPARGLEWPNAESKATSDAWIVEHHDALTKMRPRVYAINLDNDPKTRANFKHHVGQLVAAIAEGSRYHGYTDAKAEPFLQYEVSKWIDLADETPPPGWTHKYSSKVPVACTKDDAWYDADYSRLFDPAWAGVDLCDAFAKGDVHEVWLHMNGDEDPYTCPDGTKRQPGFAEILESKPLRDMKGKAKPGLYETCAGNGCLGTRDAAAFKACGRTVRVLYINSTRGPGCALHSAGHGYEWMAQSGAVPELTPRFQAFGNFDLDKRHKTPFRDWYACDKPDCLTFTGPNTVTWKVKDQTGTIEKLDQACGNVHFAPNARAHYDENDTEVLSSCESFGIEGGKPEPFSRKKVARYEPLAPDCGGAWQIYWRQSFPGRDNAAKDAAGKPMRNWWPYLFY